MAPLFTVQIGSLIKEPDLIGGAMATLFDMNPCHPRPLILHGALINDFLGDAAEDDIRPRLSASKYFNRLGKEANDFLYAIFEDRLAYRIPQLAVFDALPPRVAEHQLALEWCYRIDAGKMRIEERLGTVIR